MATRIITKYSSTPGAEPTAGDLSVGELAVNVTSRRLYTKDASGNVQEVGASSGASLYRDTFTGDGSTVNFTMAHSIINEELVDIFIDGVYQSKDNYTVAGAVVTFSSAPPLNSAIEMMSFQTTSISETKANYVEYTPAGTGATLSTVQAKLRESVSVKDFGAVGDGVTDDTAAIQAALDSGASKIIFIAGDVYLITSTITLPTCVIQGYGSKIISTVSAAATLYGSSSNIKIYGLEIEGRGNSSYVGDEYLINIRGTNNSPSAPTYISGIEIIDCYLHGVGHAAVKGQYLKNSKICRNVIENVGRSGIELSSVSYTNANENIVRNMSPGDGSSNAYGIYFSKASAPIVEDPVSSFCTCIGNTVENNLIWEALDTHGGQYITFANNVINNCKQGIVATTSNDGASVYYAPANISITGNVLTGVNRSGSNGSYGIAVGGATGYPAQNITVSDNVVENYGNQTSSSSGAIRLSVANNTSITGNSVSQAGFNGIIVASDCNGFNISANVVKDAWANSSATCGINILSANNTGHIGGNTLVRLNTGLGSNVMDRGINISSASGNLITLSENTSSAVLAYVNASPNTVNAPTSLAGVSTASVSTGASTHTFPIAFGYTFSANPRVTASTNLLASGTNSVAVVSVTNVTTTGCDVIVATSDRTNFGSSYSASVYWTATGF